MASSARSHVIRTGAPEGSDTPTTVSPSLASSRAKSKIRRFLTQERLDVSVRLGKEMLTRELKKVKDVAPKKVKKAEPVEETPEMLIRLGELRAQWKAELKAAEEKP